MTGAGTYAHCTALEMRLQPARGGVNGSAGRRAACLGECMIELIEHPDGSLTRSFGGDTLNTALYLARLGVEVDYVTALGDDAFSAEMLAAWRRESIGTQHVLRVAGRLPGLYLIQTDTGGERRFSYWRDRAPVRGFFGLPGSSAIETALAACGVFYFSGISLSLFDQAGQARLYALLEAIGNHGGSVVFDYNFRPRGWSDAAAARAAFTRVLPLCDIVLASVEDYALLFDLPAAADAVAHLQRAGIAEFVLKLAQPACIVVADGIQTLVPGAAVADVVDTTAAGDSFAAAYMAARLAGRAPADAASAGHELARIVVRHRGAVIPRAAMPPPHAAPEASGAAPG